MHYSFLSSRALLSLTGDDAISFLQGLITNDARRLEKGDALYACLLTPQGKFLHDFFVFSHEGRILIDCEAARADDLRKRLLMYKLRSKVVIEHVEGMAVMAGWGGASATTEALTFPDPRLPELGVRLYGKAAPANASEQDYHAHRLTLGVPDGALDLIAEKSFLLEWGVDQLHGVDYAKGCYVGQEVTARTHYRGQVKKAPYIVECTESALPEAGAPVQCGEALVGDLRSSVGGRGLALLRMEEVEKYLETHMPLRINAQIVSAALPLWYRKKDDGA